jgi:hypothetical protein
MCQLHQLADHNGIYSIQKRKSEEDKPGSLALRLCNLHQINLLAPFLLQKTYMTNRDLPAWFGIINIALHVIIVKVKCYLLPLTSRQQHGLLS